MLEYVELYQMNVARGAVRVDRWREHFSKDPQGKFLYMCIVQKIRANEWKGEKKAAEQIEAIFRTGSLPAHVHRDSIYSDLVGLCSKFVVTGMCHTSSTNVRPNSVLEQMSEQIDLSD